MLESDNCEGGESTAGKVKMQKSAELNIWTEWSGTISLKRWHILNFKTEIPLIYEAKAMVHLEFNLHGCCRRCSLRDCFYHTNSLFKNYSSSVAISPKLLYLEFKICSRTLIPPFLLSRPSGQASFLFSALYHAGTYNGM